jgi:hypothetical protein
MKAQRGTGGHSSSNTKSSAAAGGKSGRRAVQVCDSASMGIPPLCAHTCSIRRTLSAACATLAASPAAALPPRYRAGPSRYCFAADILFQALHCRLVRWIAHTLPAPSPAACSLQEVGVSAIRLPQCIVFRDTPTTKNQPQELKNQASCGANPLIF